MYIVNPEKLDKDTVYICKKAEASWLVLTKRLPLLARKGDDWYFAKSERLTEALKEVPLHIKIARKIL